MANLADEASHSQNRLEPTSRGTPVVPLVIVAEAVWLPKGVDILLTALVVLVLLPKALSAMVPVRLRDVLPAAILATMTAGTAMFAPPPGLRAAVLMGVAAAALAAVAWRLLRTRPSC